VHRTPADHREPAVSPTANQTLKSKSHLGPDAMGRELDLSVHVSQRTAMTLLALFLVAVIVALAVTLQSVATGVGILALSAVSPPIVLTLLFLYFERRQRPWSFAAAAALGILGVTLRLIVNSRPQLEVGGGLPLWVTWTYLTLGVLVTATSLWAFLSLRRAAGPRWGSPPPSSAGHPPA
jgi:hypothetical protein